MLSRRAHPTAGTELGVPPISLPGQGELGTGRSPHRPLPAWALVLTVHRRPLRLLQVLGPRRWALR